VARRRRHHECFTLSREGAAHHVGVTVESKGLGSGGHIEAVWAEVELDLVDG
jgi:hypothetical protein